MPSAPITESDPPSTTSLALPSHPQLPSFNRGHNPPLDPAAMTMSRFVQLPGLLLYH
jgi:hypothetical protein